jgi:hypothetical protein
MDILSRIEQKSGHQITNHRIHHEDAKELE